MLDGLVVEPEEGVQRTALLQLASADRCFLFRLSQMKFVREVARVLESGNVVKVGAAVRDDIKRIEAEKAAAIAKVEGLLSQLGL